MRRGDHISQRGEEEKLALDGCRSILPGAISNPESKFNTMRLLLTTTILLYEAIVIMYVWGFDVEIEGWLANQLLVMAAFWSIDVCLNFFHGYEKDGELIVDHRRCAKHYLRTMFGFDALLVILDVVGASVGPRNLREWDHDRGVHVWYDA